APLIPATTHHNHPNTHARTHSGQYAAQRPLRKTRPPAVIRFPTPPPQPCLLPSSTNPRLNRHLRNSKFKKPTPDVDDDADEEDIPLDLTEVIRLGGRRLRRLQYSHQRRQARNPGWQPVVDRPPR